MNSSSESSVEIEAPIYFGLDEIVTPFRAHPAVESVSAIENAEIFKAAPPYMKPSARGNSARGIIVPLRGIGSVEGDASKKYRANARAQRPVYRGAWQRQHGAAMQAQCNISGEAYDETRCEGCSSDTVMCAVGGWNGVGHDLQFKRGCTGTEPGTKVCRHLSNPVRGKCYGITRDE